MNLHQDKDVFEELVTATSLQKLIDEHYFE